MTGHQLDEERIFHTARLLPTPEAKADYLDQICAGDQNLRHRVEALLRVHAEEQQFLKSAAPESADSTLDQNPITERPISTIGRYKLMEQLGEGGMGTVFVAQQDRPIRRKVALKVIKPGMDSKAVIARFEAERQALAMMDHPHIAKVLDAGTTDTGRPYFVMELVRGIPITEYCDQNKLTIQERLALFIQVCQAIQHAHQKGIIHRDIKPSNVLVTLHDGQPIPKVIDFGVAKALNARLTDKTIYTEHLQLIGTLLYMSPEQAELSGLDIDTRSDVYALGVLLYELLTGTTPFQKDDLNKAGFDEQRRLIREQEPPRASLRISSLGETATIVAEHRRTDPKRLNQSVKGDLDWILLKALDKDRTRRYDTASSFATDVQRFLDNAPIEARPPSSAYRLSRFIRRNRPMIVTAMVVLAAIVAGSIGTSWQAWERSREKAAKHRAEVARAAAEDARQTTLHELRDTLYEKGMDHILAARSAEAETIIKRLEEAQAMDLAIKLKAIRLLHERQYLETIALLEPIVAENPESPGLRALLTDAYDGAGDIQAYFSSLQTLRQLDLNDLSAVDRVYAALAFIADPKRGAELADQVVKERPTSPIARLVRGRMNANYALVSEQTRLIENALQDIISVRWLLDLDQRVASQSLAAHLMVANIARRDGDVDWINHLEAANDVADCILKRGPTHWESFYLAEFLYERRDGSDNRERALAQYYQAAIESKNDYAAHFYFALCYELNRQPAKEVVAMCEREGAELFGLAGLGFHRAINHQVPEATRIAHQLADFGSVDALLLAVDILHLSGQAKQATLVAKSHVKGMANPRVVASSEWQRMWLLQYYAKEVKEDELLASLDNEDYRHTSACFAKWSFALGRLHDSDLSPAKLYLRECVEERQFYLHPHPWARALLIRLNNHESSGESQIESEFSKGSEGE